MATKKKASKKKTSKKKTAKKKITKKRSTKKAVELKTAEDCTALEDNFAKLRALSTKSLSECYVLAGYSDIGHENNRKNGWKILQKPHVTERYEMYLQMAQAKLDVRLERILAEMSAIAFVDPIDVFDGNFQVKNLHQIPEYARRAISEFKQVADPDGGISYQVKFHSKPTMLTKLAEIKGAFELHNKQKAPKVTIDLSFLGR